MTKIFLANVTLFLAVNDDAEACDAVSSILTDQCAKFAPGSCLVDWHYQDAPFGPEGTSIPREATPDEIEAARAGSLDWTVPAPLKPETQRLADELCWPKR